MILGFKEQIDGVPTHFKEKILAGVNLELAHMPKLHTLRAGNRWKAGDTIHMATGVRTRSYNQFNKGIPQLSVCKSVQDVKIKWKEGGFIEHLYPIDVFVDGKQLDIIQLLQFVRNDGFTKGIFTEFNMFYRWFNKDFEGQIVHWTDLRY